MKPIFKAFALIFIIAGMAIQEAEAQVSLGVDIMSRYVWRGGYFGDIVPVISGHIVPLSMGDFTG